MSTPPYCHSADHRAGGLGPRDRHPQLRDALTAWRDLPQDPEWVCQDPRVRQPHSRTPMTLRLSVLLLVLLRGLANYDLRLYVPPATPMPWPSATTTQPAVPVTVANPPVLPYALPEVQLQAAPCHGVPAGRDPPPPPPTCPGLLGAGGVCLDYSDHPPQPRTHTTSPAYATAGDPEL